MAFADKLQELRKAAGLSREQLAKASKLSRGAIRDYEQGHRKKPSFEAVIKLAAALGVDCRAFMDSTSRQRGTGGRRAPKDG